MLQVARVLRDPETCCKEPETADEAFAKRRATLRELIPPEVSKEKGALLDKHARGGLAGADVGRGIRSRRCRAGGRL